MSEEAVVEKRVVSFHYELRTNEGDLLDASEKGEAMEYLHGANNIVPGLEKAMSGKKPGDKFNVKVSPADGYGERVEEATAVPRSELPEDIDLQPGMSLVGETEDGKTMPLWITKVTDEEITLDPNHPLAGVELHFSVEVASIRAATAEELDHGHPHGPGGHHH